jgi:flagellar basal-body rod protein FlgB
MAFVSRLINQGNAPLIEQMLEFSAARHKLLAENIVNASTPGYVQKDMSLARFQKLLRERAEVRRNGPPGATGFDDIEGELTSPRWGILFHDRNNRSMEHLMTEQTKNALMHQMAIELLRKQYDSLESALKERIG